LLTPSADGGVHLKVLGRLSRLMRRDDLRTALFSAPDAPGFAAVLQRAEAT
jgi:mannitol/fructose-specific phosphotransferase system IIA component (Ntr-type)